MKSFNEFESTEEAIDIQEQRLILINQSLEENKRKIGKELFGFITDPKRRQMAIQQGRDFLSSVFRGTTSTAGRRGRGQGQMYNQMGPFRRDPTRAMRLGGAVRTFGAYELGSRALGLGGKMAFGGNSQTVDALQKMIGDYANQELKAQGSSLRMRGTGRDQERKANTLGRTGIEGLRGKRSY